jgi:hypothetical protein
VSAIFIDETGRRHVFPDGTTPEEADSLMSGKQPAQAAAPVPQVNPIEREYRARQNAADMTEQYAKSPDLSVLPTAGGFVGGLVGKVGGYPGAVVGAGIGGGLGEGARQVFAGEPLSGPRMLGQGAAQGAYEAAGGALAKGAGKLARPLMRQALSPDKPTLRSFPKAVETALQRGIPVSQKGAKKAADLRGQSAAKLRALLTKAEASGTKHQTGDVTKRVAELLNDKATPDAEKMEILKQLLEFEGQHGKSIDPTLLKAIKKRYQGKASAALKAEKIAGPSSSLSGSGAFNRELARGAKQELERIPGVAKREAETQSLVGVSRAVDNALLSAPRHIELFKPTSWPHLSRNVESQIAIKLASPKWQALLQQSPRLAVALATMSAEQDATGGY